MSFETPKAPEVKFNKNGYEIRADVLALAKDAVMYSSITASLANAKTSARIS